MVLLYPHLLILVLSLKTTLEEERLSSHGVIIGGVFFSLSKKMGNVVFLLVHNKTNIKNATSSSLVASVFFLIAAVYLNFQIKCSC